MEKVITVSPSILRVKFNESNLASRADLTKRLLRDDHLQQPEKKGEPWCTHSQMMRFLDKDGQWIFEAHQYLRKDGTIGGSGRLDPKRVRLDGVIYTIPPKP